MATLCDHKMVAMLEVKNHHDFGEGMIPFNFYLLLYIISTIHSVMGDS